MKKLNYSLLLQDQSEEDQIHYSLRKCNSNVKTFNDLDSLWASLFTETPSAVIVDIRLFNNQEKFLKNHPLVVNKTVALIIFSREADGPILRNISPEIVFDHIKFSSNYDLLIQHINIRLSYVVELEHKVVELGQMNDAKANELSAVRKQLYKIKSDELSKTIAYMMTKRFFYQFRMMKNFLPALAKTMDDFSFIEKLIVFEVDAKKQKIRTLNLSDKTTTIPSLQTEETLTDAYFKSYVVKTCNSIIADLFGLNNISFNLEKYPGKVKYVVGLKTQKSHKAHIDEEFLSRVLSGELQRFSDEDFINLSQRPLYEIFSVAQRIAMNQDARNVVYHIDFSSLNCSIEKEDYFHWDSFFNDLISGINQTLNGLGTIFINGISDLFIVADYSVEIKELMYFLDQFMTWSYFEAEESSVGKLIELPLLRLNLKKKSILDVVNNSARTPRTHIKSNDSEEILNEL